MIQFLDKSTLMAFHNDQLKRYGGIKGLWDENLLDSALAQPQASYGGNYIHEDLFHMAAAYGFHLCHNHPFNGGNRITALIAMYTFLYVNGYQIVIDKRSLYTLMMDIAKGEVKKDLLREYLKKNSRERIK